MRSRTLVAVVALTITYCLWLACVADAAPVEVGKPSVFTEQSFDTEYEASATESEQVTVQMNLKGGSSCFAVMEVDGVQVGAFADQTGGENLLVETYSTLVGAGQKWIVNVGTCSENKLYSGSSTVAIAATEGKEGPEGKEGKEGKEGSSGGGSGGSSKIDSFGPEATAELDGNTETLESMLWVLTGTLVFGAFFFVLWRELPKGRKGNV